MSLPPVRVPVESPKPLPDRVANGSPYHRTAQSREFGGKDRIDRERHLDERSASGNGLGVFIPGFARPPSKGSARAVGILE
jgi:hypothetical protein